MTRARFRIYEVEHSGDERASLEDLTRAGCSDIRVLARDYEHAEAIAVECTLPAGASSAQDLKLTFACL